MNRAVAFAGWPRHHRNAGRQQVIARQFEVGMTAAEQFREQALESCVHVVVRIAESRPGFTVDLANSAFKCLKRVVQVGQL